MDYYINSIQELFFYHLVYLFIKGGTIFLKNELANLLLNANITSNKIFGLMLKDDKATVKQRIKMDLNNLFNNIISNRPASRYRIAAEHSLLTLTLCNNSFL